MDLESRCYFSANNRRSNPPFDTNWEMISTVYEITQRISNEEEKARASEHA